MRIVFMGTPDFATASLQKLHDDGHDICGVFTKPDRVQNRGHKLDSSPVKKLALQLGFPIYQPETLAGDDAAEILRELSPDLIAVVAYGKILPAEILNIPPKGCINIHGSILPKYRGSAPIQRAVLNGEKNTGVTAMYMAQGMDTGDIISIKTTDIGEYETSGELFDRLRTMAADLLGETVFNIENGIISRTPQNDAEATYAPPFTKDMSPINWEMTADEIINQIRALNPWPVATTEIDGISFKVFSAIKSHKKTDESPGTIIVAGKDGIEIACSDGSVIIKELQAPGGKRMKSEDYLRGHPICL